MADEVEFFTLKKKDDISKIYGTDNSVYKKIYNILDSKSYTKLELSDVDVYIHGNKDKTLKTIPCVHELLQTKENSEFHEVLPKILPVYRLVVVSVIKHLIQNVKDETTTAKEKTKKEIKEAEEKHKKEKENLIAELVLLGKAAINGSDPKTEGERG